MSISIKSVSKSFGKFTAVDEVSIEIATGSLSMAITLFAPRTLAAIARMPVPVPRSIIEKRESPVRESFSSKRRDIAVVACSPVPNAAPAGI